MNSPFFNNIPLIVETNETTAKILNDIEELEDEKE